MELKLERGFAVIIHISPMSFGIPPVLFDELN
jgi:hypothetical protein